MTIHAIGLTTLNNTAKDFRNDMSSLLFGATPTRPTGARSGVRYGTPTTTVSLVAFAGTIKPHSGVMDVQTAAAAGPYFYAVTANETFTVSAAHATLPRVDIVTIRINDDVEDSSGLESATAHYKAGTAAASPVAPSPDTTRDMIIATIAVPASGGGNPVASWVAPTAVAAGGIIPVRNTTERDALQTAYPGTTDAPLVIWLKSASAFYYNDGTGWRALADLSVLEAATGVKHFRVADSSVRDALAGTYTLAAGDKARLTDTGVVYRYDGSAWKAWESDWITYTPTFASTVVGTGGTHTGRYRWEQGRVRVQTFTVLGTSGFSFAGYVFALPVTAVTPHSQYGSYPSSASFEDVSASVNYEGYVSANNVSTTQAAVLLLGTNGVRVGPNSTTPFTWAAGDKAKTDFVYDPA